MFFCIFNGLVMIVVLGCWPTLSFSICIALLAMASHVSCEFAMGFVLDLHLIDNPFWMVTLVFLVQKQWSSTILGSGLHHLYMLQWGRGLVRAYVKCCVLCCCICWCIWFNHRDSCGMVCLWRCHCWSDWWRHSHWCWLQT